MASLLRQRGYFYAQFYDSSRRPQRKKIPLKTKEKRAARRLLGRMEDKCALGEYDPWTDGREHELFGWEPRPKQDLSTLGKAKAAFLDDRAHLRPETLRTYDEVLRLFVSFLGEGFATERLRPRQLERWLASTDSLADATKRKYIKHVGYLIRYLVERGWLEEDISKQVGLNECVIGKKGRRKGLKRLSRKSKKATGCKV